MKNKIIIGIITLAALIIFITTARRALWSSPERELSIPLGTMATSTPLNPGQYPTRLLIPALGINAKIEAVGINLKGNMAAPSNFADVGWYRYGPVPGQIGSANLAGHVDNGLALPGVFKPLDQIKTGDQIFIETKNGSQLRFVVAEIRTYPYQDVPLDLLFNQNDAVRLNLITCAGKLLTKDRTYDQRLVVFAKLQ